MRDLRGIYINHSSLSLLSFTLGKQRYEVDANEQSDNSSVSKEPSSLQISKNFI